MTDRMTKMLVAIAIASLKQRQMIADHGADCGSYDFCVAIDKAIGATDADVHAKLAAAYAAILGEAA